MKIYIARQKNDFSAREISSKSSLKHFARILRNRKQKKVILSTIKNIRNEKYSNAVNDEQSCFQQKFEI